MSRGKSVVWMTLLVAALGCGEEAPARASDTTRTLLAQPRAEDLSTELDVSRLGGGAPSFEIDLLGINMGSPEAPVKVIEFVDFGCGYCRQFQLETFPVIQAEFIDTNMVEWKYMPFVSGMFGNSLAVTQAAECALVESPRHFGVFTTRLWVQQAEWKASDEPEALARAWILETGADGAAFDGCLQDDERMERVRSHTALAGQLGVRATPTFWIVGVGPVQGALPIEAFRQIFTQIHTELTQNAG
jgi:protein-disulfide isomerase